MASAPNRRLGRATHRPRGSRSPDMNRRIRPAPVSGARHSRPNIALRKPDREREESGHPGDVMCRAAEIHLLVVRARLGRGRWARTTSSSRHGWTIGGYRTAAGNIAAFSSWRILASGAARGDRDGCRSHTPLIQLSKKDIIARAVRSRRLRAHGELLRSGTDGAACGRCDACSCASGICGSRRRGSHRYQRMGRAAR